MTFTEMSLQEPAVTRTNGLGPYPETGQMMYDSLSGEYRIWDGDMWQVLGIFNNPTAANTAIGAGSYPKTQPVAPKPEPQKEPAKPKKLWARKII